MKVKLAGGLAVTLTIVSLAVSCTNTQQASKLYCYRTLARVDCHAAAVPGEQNRLVGFYDASLVE